MCNSFSTDIRIIIKKLVKSRKHPCSRPNLFMKSTNNLKVLIYSSSKIS